MGVVLAAAAAAGSGWCWVGGPVGSGKRIRVTRDILHLVVGGRG